MYQAPGPSIPTTMSYPDTRNMPWKIPCKSFLFRRHATCLKKQICPGRSSATLLTLVLMIRFTCGTSKECIKCCFSDALLRKLWRHATRMLPFSLINSFFPSCFVEARQISKLWVNCFFGHSSLAPHQRQFLFPFRSFFFSILNMCPYLMMTTGESLW